MVYLLISNKAFGFHRTGQRGPRTQRRDMPTAGGWGEEKEPARDTERVTGAWKHSGGLSRWRGWSVAPEAAHGSRKMRTGLQI